MVRQARAASANHFSMNLDGIHGLGHWDRVHENGVFLAKHSGGDLLVVELFAYLHDSCRQSDSWDSDRLDLGRVGIKPDPKLLSTERAKHLEVINWG